MKKEYIAIDGKRFDIKNECIAYEKTLLPKPNVLPKKKIDLDAIIKDIKSCVESYIEGDEDWDEYLSENMVMYIYGDDAWNKLNELI